MYFGVYLSSAHDIFLGTCLPIFLGGLVLVAFPLSIGWLKELFAPPHMRGRRWMWIAVTKELAAPAIPLA